MRYSTYSQREIRMMVGTKNSVVQVPFKSPESKSETILRSPNSVCTGLLGYILHLLRLTALCVGFLLETLASPTNALRTHRRNSGTCGPCPSHENSTLDLASGSAWIQET